jgi:PST family polysaccharide transporter
MYRKRALFENMLSLLVLQGANYVLPLITLPYLVRVLGTAHYGLLVFAQAFAGYFVILTDFGFNLTATRQVAVHQDDPDRIRRIFCATMLAKLLLLLLSAVCFAIVVLIVPQFRGEWELHCAAFLMVAGSVLYPVWLFQGMETMKYITLLNISTKAAAAAAIFLLVKSSSDYVLAAFLQSAGFLAAGVLGLATVRRLFGLSPTIAPWREVRAVFVDGWHVFVSQASVSLFGNTNVFLLGLFASPPVVGSFAIAEKIVRAVIGLSIPISGAIYPTVGALFQRSRDAAVAFLRRVVLYGGLLFLAVSLALLVGADPIVRLVAGAADIRTSTLVRIMSILPLTVFIDNIYGTQILLNIGRQKQFMWAVTIAGVFSVVASLLAIPYWGAFGSATVFTVTECLVLVLMAVPVHRMGIRLHGSLS